MSGFRRWRFYEEYPTFVIRRQLAQEQRAWDALSDESYELFMSWLENDDDQRFWKERSGTIDITSNATIVPSGECKATANEWGAALDEVLEERKEAWEELAKL